MATASSSPDSKPKARPTSTLARSFSATLDDAFLMSDNLDSLTEEISRKRTSITMQKTELEQIESRLRAMEAELQAKQARLPCISHNGSKNSQSTSQRRQGLEGVFHSSAQKESPKKQMPLAAPSPLSPSRGSRARPPSSSSESSSSSDSSDMSPPPEPVKVKGKPNKVTARNIPSRGRA